MWNETYATDVHFLLSRLPNPTARGDGWAALSLGLAQGTLEGAGPPHRALLPSESKAWPAGCLTSASCPCNRAGTNNGALVQTRFSASEVTLEMLLHQHLGRLILRSTQPASCTGLASVALTTTLCHVAGSAFTVRSPQASEVESRGSFV